MKKHPALEECDCRRGAPMGRRNNVIKAEAFRVKRVALDDGYDQGGAYWGYGAPLFACWNRDGLRI